jgi:quinol---cytochrome-c reductase cytochrome c subunit
VRLLNRSAGRLSRHRRGPLAGVLVILAGLLLTGGLFTAIVNTTAQADETASSADQVAQGRDLFLVSCSFCHGQNGEGIRSEDGDQIGPSLIGVGAAAVDFQVGTGRMPMVQPGAQAPDKPRTTRATTASRVSPTPSARPRSCAAARSS